MNPEDLEEKNFRIDPANWKTIVSDDGTCVKINPEGDVTELLDGEFAGEQHFSYDAMVRETAKTGKRVPTPEEWGEIIRSINPDIDPKDGWQDDVSVREKLRLKLAGGCHHCAVGTYYTYGTYGCYWAFSSAETYGYVANFSATQADPTNYVYREDGFLIRCLKN